MEQSPPEVEMDPEFGHQDSLMSVKPTEKHSVSIMELRSGGTTAIPYEIID